MEKYTISILWSPDNGLPEGKRYYIRKESVDLVRAILDDLESQDIVECVASQDHDFTYQIGRRFEITKEYYEVWDTIWIRSSWTGGQKYFNPITFREACRQGGIEIEYTLKKLSEPILDEALGE